MAPAPRGSSFSPCIQGVRARRGIGSARPPAHCTVLGECHRSNDNLLESTCDGQSHMAIAITGCGHRQPPNGNESKGRTRVVRLLRATRTRTLDIVRGPTAWATRSVGSDVYGGTVHCTNLLDVLAQRGVDGACLLLIPHGTQRDDPNERSGSHVRWCCSRDQESLFPTHRHTRHGKRQRSNGMNSAVPYLEPCVEHERTELADVLSIRVKSRSFRDA